MKERSIVLYDWHGMEQFGVKYLTGESCRYAMRALCDLNQAGRELMVDYFGLGAGPLARPWNSSVNEQPSVASILLHRDSLPQIAQFALFRAGALAVLMAQQRWEQHGLFESQLILDYTELIERQIAQDGKTDYTLVRNYGADTSAPHLGTRMLHAMSGRTV